METRPILLGKLKEYASGRIAVVAGEGELRSVSAQDRRVLEQMNGFQTFAEIAVKLNLSQDAVQAVFDTYKAERYLSTMDYWNKLHWSPSRRIYVNEKAPAKGDTDTDLVHVPISPPADPWFCTGDELIWIRTLIETRIGRTLPAGTLLLANNGIQNNVFFWEIVANGGVVLIIRFSGEGERDWQYTFAEDIDTFGWQSFTDESWEKARTRQIDAHTDRLNRLVDDTIVFIEEVCARGSERPLLFFSGGKESIVTLDLFRRAGISAQLLFAGTGMEFPEDEQFMKDFAEFMRTDQEHSRLFDLHIEPGDKDKMTMLFSTHRGLGLGKMWCRSQLKYPIRNRAMNKLYPRGVSIAFEGSRWYESDFRRSHPRINVISDIQGYHNARQIWAHALAEWSGFDIWCYIYANKLMVNPLYGMGFQRTTCWSCPLVNPYHVQQSKKYHADKWKAISQFSVTGFEKESSDRCAPTSTAF